MPFDIRGKVRQVNITGAPYALIKARGDGNCLFHSAGHLLERAVLLLPAHNSHATFRAHVVGYVDQHAKDTSALASSCATDWASRATRRGRSPPRRPGRFDQRVAYLRRAGTWGDEACITAIENLYNVEALVHDSTGSLTNAFGLRHYTPHHGPATKLRLCAQFVGSAPYHYDLYLPNGTYDAARDGPDQTLAPVVDEAPKPKPEAPPPSDPQGPRHVAPREPPEEEWPYFMDPRGLKPYGPPIVHRQFPYTAAWLDAKGSPAPGQEGPPGVAGRPRATSASARRPRWWRSG